MKSSESPDKLLPVNNLYRFGQFALDSRKRTVSRADSPVFLTPKAFDVLLFLVQNPNRLVTKEELLQAVWGDTFVEEGNLTQYISHLRKALGDNSEESRLIVTIARKGYQFTANVTVAKAADTATQATGQVSASESPAVEAVPKAPKRWRKAAVAGASAVLLVVVCFASWWHFGGMGPPRSQKIMLAVLPFENLTGDPNKEYLADGLTEETISQLGRLNPDQLGVIARTSVMGYKHKDERLDQIGRDLSVQYVLENSLRESGNHIRLTAQLIQVKDQTHLWSQDYDYLAKDILNVQDDVAKAVAREIRLRLSSQQQADLARSRPVNPEAFDAYLQGYYFFQRNTDKDTEMAAKYYERATQLDPAYALAWVGLSRVRNWQANTGLVPAEEGQRLAREAVERALALNPNLAEAHSPNGTDQTTGRLRLGWRGCFLPAGDCSRTRKSRQCSDWRLALPPRSAALTKLFNWPVKPLTWIRSMQTVGWSLERPSYFMGRLNESVADLKKVLELSPDVWFSHSSLSEIYILQGRPQRCFA